MVEISAIELDTVDWFWPLVGMRWLRALNRPKAAIIEKDRQGTCLNVV